MEPRKLRILVIDDSTADARVLQSILQQIRPNAFELVHCTTGEQGERAISEETFDCVFLDYMLDAESGLDVLQAIRASGNDVPIVTLSGCGCEQVAVEALQLGAQDYLVKGDLRVEITPSALERAISNAIEKVHYQRQLTAHKKELEEKNSMLTDLLERERSASRQLQEAIQTAEAAITAKSKVLARVTHELRTPLHAIIGSSGGLLEQCELHPLDDHQQDRLRGILTNGEHLLRLINDVLDISRIEAGRMDACCTTFHATGAIESAQEFAIPWGELLEDVGGEQATLNEIVAAYVDEMEEVAPCLPRAVQERNAPSLCNAAHKLKSALKFFHQWEAAELAERLEQRGAQDDLKNAATDVEEVAKFIQQFIRRLKAYCETSTLEPLPTA